MLSEQLLSIKIDNFWERKCSDIVINGVLRISFNHWSNRVKLMDISNMRTDLKIFPVTSNVIEIECGNNREEEG